MADIDQRKFQIITLIKQLADEANGKAPGAEKFSTRTGIKPHVWQGKLWRTWSEALAEAGFEGSGWVTARSEEDIFDAIIKLADRIGKFPNSTDMKFERANNPDFPDQTTIAKRKSMSELAKDLYAYARDRNLEKIASFCEVYLKNNKTIQNIGEPKSSEPNEKLGHVYMMQYGKEYKIGRTSSVNRRSRQIQIELPDSTTLIHSILTDDPVGVETYWHRRFQQYRGNGEWFRLPPNAVTAFKKWTKIA